LSVAGRLRSTFAHFDQGAGRPILEVVFQGKTHRVAIGVAISVGDNGYVIGANIA
jgi:hypothetical protein